MRTGRPRMGAERRKAFSARINPVTLAILSQYKIRPSEALSLMAQYLREKKLLEGLAEPIHLE